ncbi:uncharacterized protein LOC122366226 isoform X6 [Amphibalanus amphitrite]|uniref:uncharacterized protein LOC122366226 isoform X6 n=1 Tax=Amphibalanus amphitrite TaxID=1232801 RepID=UPI001C91BEB9|nr:uncharacterized protein LOC122366226 isoform X6 [Amphibalanus amphitrite]
MHILLSFSQKAKRLQIAAAPRSSCQLKLKLWKKELKLVILLTQVGKILGKDNTNLLLKTRPLNYRPDRMTVTRTYTLRLTPFPAALP